MVSVIIPTYNRAGCLRESIDSALAQDYPALEVIVVDDGSTDETSEICKEYGDRIRYFWKPNGGAASAMNYGMKRMSGAWVKIIGSDDLLEKNALTTFVAYAEASGADWLLSDYVVINAKGKPIEKWRGRLFQERERTKLEGDKHLRALWSGREAGRPRQRWLGGALSGMGFAHRSLFLRVGLLDETLRAGADWEWALRASFIHGCHEARVPLSLYRMRYHHRQISRSKRDPRLEEWGEIRSAFKHRLASPGETPAPTMAHLRQDVRRSRRVYLPLVLAMRILWGAPFFKAVRFWAWAIAPSIMDQVYWGAYPPVEA